MRISIRSVRKFFARDIPLKYAVLIFILGMPLCFEIGATGRSSVELAWLKHTINRQEHAISLSATVTLNSPELLPTIESLREGSPTFREHWETILQSPKPIYVSTYSDMDWEDKDSYGAAKQYQTGVSRRFLGGVLLVNKKQLTESFEQYIKTRPWDREIALLALENEVRATFAHEVEHFYPVIKSGGKMSNSCKDPEDETEMRTACSLMQENIIRRELRIPESCYYGSNNPSELVIRYKSGQLACYSGL